MSYLLGCPLEASDNWILDFIEVLDSLGAVHQDVGAVGVGAEAPDLPNGQDNKSIKIVDKKSVMQIRINYYADPDPGSKKCP